MATESKQSVVKVKPSSSNFDGSKGKIESSMKAKKIESSNKQQQQSVVDSKDKTISVVTKTEVIKLPHLSNCFYFYLLLCVYWDFHFFYVVIIKWLILLLVSQYGELLHLGFRWFTFYVMECGMCVLRFLRMFSVNWMIWVYCLIWLVDCVETEMDWFMWIWCFLCCFFLINLQWIG